MKSLKSLFLVALLFLQVTVLTAAQEAAMSAWIADIKYSRADGVKICEVQPVSHSRFRGSDFAHGEDGYVAQQMIPLIAQNFEYIWYRPTAQCDDFILEQLKDHGAISFSNVRQLEADPLFKRITADKPRNASNLNGYRALVWCRESDIGDIESFQQRHPGVVVMDAGIWSSGTSKATMNDLFRSDEVLKNFKPRCNKYKRVYSPMLSAAIQKDIKAETYVIKPLNSTKGQGVLIVPKAQLEKTLKTILTKNDELRYHADPEMRYWYKTTSVNFVVEEFFASDPVYAPHLGNLPYDATMRAVFLLSYSKGKVEFTLLDTYWKLPKLSLMDNGTETEKHKSFGEEPHFAAVSTRINQKVSDGLKEGMPRLYELLLGL